MTKRTQLDRNCEKLRSLKGEIRCGLREIVRKQGTFADYMTLGDRIRKDASKAKLPDYMRMVLGDVLWEMQVFMREELCEWRLMYRGQLVTRDQIADGTWIEVVAEQGAFCWKGTTRVYMTNESAPTT